jgi:osmotically-inducible protein OsmY
MKPSSNVTVAVDDRVALLQGSVETYREKMDAEHLARRNTAKAHKVDRAWSLKAY